MGSRYGVASCCQATKKCLVVTKECNAWARIWNVFFKVNCNQNLTSKREYHIYKVLKCSRYISALPSLKLTVAIEMKSILLPIGITLTNMTGSRFDWEIDTGYVWLWPLINHLLLFIPKFSYSLEWSIILHLIELTALTLNLLSMTSSGSLSVGSLLILCTKHSEICGRVRMTARLLEFYFFFLLKAFSFSSH